MFLTRTIVFVLLCLTELALGQSQNQVRLNGNGATNTSGRVEIYHNEEWGTVCDHNFELVDANVTCKQLGHSYATAVLNGSTHNYGPGPSRIWMVSVHCQGNERSLDECMFNGWGNTLTVSCSASESVAVVCATPTPVAASSHVAAVQGTSTGICQSQGLPPPTDVQLRVDVAHPEKGYVEVRFGNSSWGLVCDDFWGQLDAQVVCRSLCYDASVAKAGADMFRINASGQYLMDDVECTGTESSVTQCPASLQDNCGPTEAAMVTCADPSPVYGDTNVSIVCGNDSMTVTVHKHSTSTLTANDVILVRATSGCLAHRQTTTTSISITIPYNSTNCGIRTNLNRTHIMYESEIQFSTAATTSSGVVTRNDALVYILICDFPRYHNVSDPMRPVQEIVTLRANGSFVVWMDFFTDGTFQHVVTNYPYSVTLGDYLNVGVFLLDVYPETKIVVGECYCTPDNNKDNPIRESLIQQKCPDEPTVSIHFIEKVTSAFRYQTFRFTNNSAPSLYVHCEATVCQQDEKDGQCDRTCGYTGRRRKRSRSTDHTVVQVAIGPVYVNDPTATTIGGTVTSQSRMSSVKGSTSPVMLTRTSAASGSDGCCNSTTKPYLGITAQQNQDEENVFDGASSGPPVVFLWSSFWSLLFSLFLT